jgi:L-serine deaminase
MGGEVEVSVAAASMALQNSLGMICDSVANRVEYHGWVRTSRQQGML